MLNDEEISEKYTIEQRRENIYKFINDNSNQDGLDLTKLYFAQLVYSDYRGTDLAEKQLANKIAIVYIEDYADSNAEYNYIYMDLFRERLFQTTVYEIPGVLSFAPFIRNGLTISNLTKLSYLLGVERLPIEKISCLYSELEKIDYKSFLKMSLDDLHSLYTDEFGIRK